MTGRPVARVGDAGVCPAHGSPAVAVGSSDVLAEGRPMARVGDSSECGAAVAQGVASVVVNGRPVAFLGAATAHGGRIVAGAASVFVGVQASAGDEMYSAQFRATEAASGEPLSGLAYRIEVDDGTIVRGMTDERGRTLRIATAGPQQVRLFWEEQPADEWSPSDGGEGC